MKKCLIKKLNQSQGASLMLALLVFLICAMCGSVVLAAGTAAAGRVAGLKKSDQSVYTLTSAAKTVGAELNGVMYTYELDKGSLKNEKLTPADSILNTTMKSLCDNVAQGKAKEAKVSVTVTAAPVASATNVSFAEVTAVFTMDKDFNLTVVFTISGETGSTVTMTAAVAPYVYSTEKTEEYPKAYTWADPVIVVGDKK